jgi:glutathione S-transferase
MEGGKRLITFAPMIDSEFCRVLLAHYGVAYQEEDHLFGWASLVSLVNGGTPQIPLLCGDGLRIAGPRGVADHFDAVAPSDKKLMPADGVDAAQVNADWSRFNGTLGTAVAVICYYHLLPQRGIMLAPLSHGLSPAETRALPAVYPAVAGLLRLLLRLNAANAAAAVDQARALFDEITQRIADGRQYLVGDRLTLSDLALATAAAPLLQPPGFGSPMPAIDQMPEDLQRLASEFRAHGAAKFVRQIYETWIGRGPP